MIEWEKIRTEYVTSSVSYRALADKYQVPYGTLTMRARVEGWSEKRKKHREKTLQKSLDIIGDRQAMELSQVDHMADELLCKLRKAIEELDLSVIHHKESGTDEDGKWEKTYDEMAPGGTVDRQGLRQLTACLKDLRQLKDIQSELDTLEQKARIQKLRKDGGEETEEITVELAEDIKPFSS